ncbi:PRC-barrel domain-containing protein [Halobaculum halobium]|uniref:PRC-barrel domain-containing protein n=1 Tax=Halobaculum halobium TaxID=3032281 RepID=A0ABD5TA43_9EURY|nr:PRC-barrel domain-containing protein [Halobaculum sp. SYNS20]
MPSDTTPVTDLANTAVFTADGARVGRVTDVLVDLESGGSVALALSDVAEETVGGLPSAAAGVRVPYRLVRGVGDAIVLRSAAREAALPLPGARGDGRAPDTDPGDRDDPPARGDASADEDPIV